jgi:hypothetical protein
MACLSGVRDIPFLCLLSFSSIFMSFVGVFAVWNLVVCVVVRVGDACRLLCAKIRSLVDMCLFCEALLLASCMFVCVMCTCRAP